MHGEIETYDEAGFHAIFATMAFVKWGKLLYSLLPFHRAGLPLLPIIHSVQECGPFVAIAMFMVGGLIHAYLSLRHSPLSVGESALMVYRLGVLTDFDAEQVFESTDQ